MTAIERFKEFFEKEGVEYEMVDEDIVGKISHNPIETADAKFIISVSQANFYFDINGDYLGVEDDELGNWYKKKN